MILVLKGADFSTNNLGQVEVNQDLLPYTEAAILASGNAQMTPPQKSALDNLFRTMEAGQVGGVMSKMRKVYLPIIAGDVSKALTDYSTNSFNVDLVLNSANWKIQSHGLIGYTEGQPITLTLNNPLDGGNFSCFALRTEKMVAGAADSHKVMLLRGKTNTGKWLGLRCNSISSNGMVSGGESGANKWYSSYSKTYDSVSALGISMSGSTTFAISPSNGGTSETFTPTNVADMSGETSQSLYVFGLGDMNMQKPYAVAMIGEALTEQQTRDVVSKINALYDAFNV